MSERTMVDQSTSELIRNATEAAQAGRLNEACEMVRRGFAEGDDNPALHALLGALLLSSQSPREALPHLEAAQSARPDDPVIARNLASALVAVEEFGSVPSILPDQIAMADPSGNALRLRAYAAQMAGDLGAAIKDYERVVLREPRDWETWNNLGNARVNAGDLTRGIDALARAAQLNPAASGTRFNLVLALRDAREFELAEAELRSMAEDFPTDPTPFSYLFSLLQMQGFHDAAREALESSIERDPTDPAKFVALGQQQLLKFDFDGAIATFEKALSFEGNNGPAFLGIADAYEYTRPEALTELVERAAAAQVDPIYLKVIEAMAAQRQKRHQDAADALASVPANFDPIRRWHLEAQIRDGLGEYEAAFAAFDRMNQAMAAEPDGPVERAAGLRLRLEQELAATTPEWRQGWVAPPVTSSRPSPVFLVGFPRSGTTLLDTLLMGHPDVEVMEEKPVLSRLRHETGGHAALAAMSEDEVRRLQERYFQLAAGFVDLRPGALLVDKSPLHMQNVAQIVRLFPDARFILALRHPADVILSCYMAKFRLNSSMSNFVQLDTTADFYDLTFRLWENARGLFNPDVHTVVYEQLIEDPEAVLRPLTESLGLPWRPELLDHQRTAEARGVVTTASYAQVTQPLYRGAAGRWQRYRKHLEPVLPTIAPWAKKMGYEL